MGLFDKIKNKRKKSKNEVKKDISQEISREEFTKKINKVKQPITNMDTKLGGKSNTIITKKINQILDDTIIEHYGTSEEKKQLVERKKQEEIEKEKKGKFYEKMDIAKRMNDINSIKIYHEIINDAIEYPDLIIYAYHEMMITYAHIRKFDKYIETANECIEFKKSINENYNYEQQKIKFMKELLQEKNLIDMQKEGVSLSYSNPDKAVDLLKNAIKLGSTRYQTFKALAEIYIRRRDLDSAIDVLNIGIERIEKDNSIDSFVLHNQRNDGLNDILMNINHKIEHGYFKWDCLPYDSGENKSKIKEAKSLLNEDTEKGILMLEDVIANGTYTNTAYYTLYRLYNKSKDYEQCLRVCDKAIDVLGYFSVEKLEKWMNYKNKIIVKIEKENQ